MIGLAACPTFILFYFGKLEAALFLAGELLTIFSLLTMIIIWYLIFKKKLIAFGIVLVVLKVPFFAGLVMALLNCAEPVGEFNIALWLVSGVLAAAGVVVIGTIRAFYLV